MIFLKTLPVTVNRQKIIGNYIADFYCAEYRIVIELDGSQHYEEKAAQRDRKRDTFFREKGITVLRYTNLDIKRNFKGVCQDILNHMRPSETAPGGDTSSVACGDTFPSRGRHDGEG